MESRTEKKKIVFKPKTISKPTEVSIQPVTTVSETKKPETYKRPYESTYETKYRKPYEQKEYEEKRRDYRKTEPQEYRKSYEQTQEYRKSYEQPQKQQMKIQKEYIDKSREQILETEEKSEQIVKLIENEMKEQEFSVIEAMSDLGTISYQLLKSKKVRKVVTFMSGERNEQYRLNVTEKFSSKSLIFDENFKYSPSVEMPYILFFYPMWLHKNIGIFKRDKLVPEFFNLTVNDIPIVDMINNENPTLFAFYIPKEINVNKDLGYNMKIFDLENNKLVIIYKSGEDVIKVGKSFVDPLKIKTENEWKVNLREYLKDLLKNIVKEKQVETLLTENVMDIWYKAFTHETFDLNNNYEQLETIGDRVLELPFVKYILMKYPDLTSKEITLIKSHYMSKLFQGSTSRKLGFQPWIRIAEGISTISVLEDVFESFAGALFESADKNFGPGFGYAVTLNFIIFLFKNIEIDLNVAKGKPKSQIKEIFEKLQWGKGGPTENFTFDETENNYVFTVSFSDAALDWFQNKKRRVPDRVFGIGFGTSKTNAENNAYTNALRNLKNMRITWDWAQEQKEVAELTSPEYSLYMDKVLDNIEKLGFDKFEFFTSKTTTTLGTYIVQLIGVKMDEYGKKYREILVSGKFHDIPEGKLAVLKEFSDKNFQ
jgi:dsRNA-specific ribonuclease